LLEKIFENVEREVEARHVLRRLKDGVSE